MAGRPARHRFPQGAAAQRRAGFAADRGLDPRDAGRTCGRLPQHPAAVGAAHASARATRLRGTGRPRQPDGRFRRRWPHRLQLHAQLDRWRVRRGDHQRKPVQQGLGRQLEACGQRRREWLVGGDADPLVHRADAPGQRWQAHAEGLPGPRDRFHRRTRRLAGRQLPAAALPVGLQSRRSPAIQPVAAGDHAVCLRPLRQRRRPQRLRRRRRHLLEAQWPVPADRDAQSRFRPGRERRPGGQLRRHRNLRRRQASVLHREPGPVRIHHAVRLQPAAVHPPRRQPGRRQEGSRRHHRRGQGQRQHRRHQVRRLHRRRSGRRSAARSAHCGWCATSAPRTSA